MRATRYRLGLLALSAALALALGASVARAATLTVTKLTDGVATGGQCTLREAIENANADAQVSSDCPAGTAGSNTINFAVSGTVTLKNRLPSLTGPLVIDGSGQSVTISGAGVVSILETAHPLSVLHLELTNGLGAITSSGPSLSLSGVTVNASGVPGGAVTNGSGSLQVTDSSFNGNAGPNGDGGAISTAGPVTLTHDTFSKNSATDGGAVEASSSVTVTRSTFSSNSAGGDGGAIHENDESDAGAVNISHSSFTANKAGRYGGAVSSVGPVTVAGSSFASNTSSAAGGAVATPDVPCDGATCVTGPAPSAISGSDFSENSSAGPGGAVFAVGPLTVTGTTFSANSGSPGGAVDATGGAMPDPSRVIPDPVTVSRSTFFANSGAQGAGLAMSVVSAATITNTSFVENNGQTGGGIFTDSAAAVSFTTFDRNTGAQGSDLDATAPVTVRATIMGAGTGPDCSGTSPVDSGFNIASDGSCGLSAASSKSSTDPGLSLAGLTENGGPTATVALTAGSPAIDAIPAARCTDAAGGAMLVDQRLFARPADGNLDGIANCDIGAYESGSIPYAHAQPGPVFAVTTAADSHGPVCLRPAYGSDCSLHDALMMANAYALAHHKQATVTLAPGATYDLTVVDNRSGAGANALPVVIGTVLIKGAGAKIQRDASAPPMRLLQIARGARVKIVDAKLAGGEAASAGGGVLNLGTLALLQTFVHGNSSGANGGGLFNAGIASVSSSTFSANTASSVGGGIFNRGRLRVANSTLTGNKGRRGGAIGGSAGGIRLTNASLSFDHAAQGATEVAIAGGAISFANTIVGYTVGATNCSYAKAARHTDTGHNLDSGTSCMFSARNASISGSSPRLGALGAHGGPTPTMALKAGSPAINAASNAICKAAPINNLDQRGVRRITGTDRRCDIGAFEFKG